MTWAPIVFLAVVMLLALWAFASAGPDAAESAERARLAARAAKRDERLAELFVEDAPLVLILGRWTGTALEEPRTLEVTTRQDVLEQLVAATGEELERVPLRDADVAARRLPTFGRTQHPLAGRIDVIEKDAVARALALVRRWSGEGKADLAEALVEFEGGLDVARVTAAIESGTAGPEPAPALEAAALVKPLREALEGAKGGAVALVWLPAAEHVDAALATISPPPPPAPSDAPSPTHAAVDAVVSEALLAEVRTADLDVTQSDGVTYFGTSGGSWRAWTQAHEQRGRATWLAVTVEVGASFDGPATALRAGFAAIAVSPEDAARALAHEAVELLLAPFLSAAAPFRADHFRWEPGLGGDAPAAYEVHAGPIHVDGHPPPDMVEQLSHRHPFHALRDALAPRLGRRLHLIELRAGHAAGEPLEDRSRVDGALVPGVASPFLAALSWPPDTAPIAVRSFVVLRAARG